MQISSSVPVPQTIGRYQIERVIGIGAMGIVYRAFDPVIERTVAIKVLKRPRQVDPERFGEYIQRFYVEARAAGRLSHPNIVAIYDVGTWEGVPYIVMEYVDGHTLRAYLKQKVQFTWQEATAIVREVARALAYAHQQGVVHRDIKPGNIMVLRDWRVKVMDFGVAQMLGPGGSDTNVLVGTPYYMAPEVIAGESPRPASDLFSLGVVYYQLLTHHRPFEGNTMAEVMSCILHATPLPPSHWNPAVPKIVDTIVLRLLSKSWQARPSGEGLARELQRLLETSRSTGLRDVARLLEETAPEMVPAGLEPRWRTVFRTGWAHWQALSRWRRWALLSVFLLGVFLLGWWIFRESSPGNTVPMQKTATTVPGKATPPPASPVPVPSPAPTVSPELAAEIDRHFQLGKNYCLNRLYRRCFEEMQWVLQHAPDHEDARRYLDEARRHLSGNGET